MMPRTKKLLAFLLAASQVLTPLLAQAATYQLQSYVPKLEVSGSTASTVGSGSSGTSGSGTTSGTTSTSGSTGASGSTGTSSGGSTGSSSGTSSSSTGSSGSSGSGATGTPAPAAPSAYLFASATTVDLGNVNVGSTASATPITISNTGNATFTFSAPISTVGQGFSATNNCGTTLLANSACQVVISVTPQSAGALTGGVYIQGNAPNAPMVLTPHATGMPLVAAATWAVPSVNFGGVPLNSSSTRTATLANTGNLAADWSTLTGVVPGFTADASSCSNVAPGTFCTVSFTFSPVAAGAYTAANVSTSAGPNKNMLTLVGTGLKTSVATSTGALGFGNQAVGQSSAAQTVLVTNTGNTDLSVAQPTVSGPFAASTDCAATIAAGTSCLVNVAFNPTVGGTAAGQVSFGTGAGAQTVALSGYGVVALTAALSSSAASVVAPNGAFASTNVGATAQQTIYVVPATGNLGTLTVGASLTGDPAITLVSAKKVTLGGANFDCGAVLSTTGVSGCQSDDLATGSATALALTVQFAPTGNAASHAASLAVTHNGTNSSPLVLNLTGTATGQAAATLSTASVPLAVAVGQTATSSVRLTNSGTDMLALTTAPAVAGDAAFSAASNCADTLAPGAYCDTTVTFAPTLGRTVTSILSFPTSVGTQTVALSGTGLLATATLSAMSLNLGDVVLGSTSGAQTVTLSNNGNAPLQVAAATVAAPFAQTTTCGTSIAAGESCTYSVTFTPSVMGAAVSQLTVNTNLGTQSVALAGKGLQTSDAVSPSALTFGTVNVGSSSTAQTVALSNTGNTVVTLSLVSLTGPFTATQSCGNLPATIATSSNCQVSVTFSPTAMGAVTGTLTLITSGGTQTVSLSGSGLQATASLGGTSLALGSVNVGYASAAQTVTLTNSGNIALNVSAASVTGAFSDTTTCGSSLAPGASCAYSVTFAPTAMGAASGTLTINTALGAQTVALTGTGLQATASLSATSLALGSVNVGSTTSAQSVTLTNNGNTPLSLSAAGITAPFANTTTCASSLAAGASCSYSVTLTPTSLGAVSGTLTVNTALGAQTVNLSGRGLLAVAGVNPSSLAFGSVNVGSTSAASTVTLSNTGNTAMTVGTPTVTGAFAQTTTCGATLAAGSTCTFSVTFVPTAMGAATGTLSIPTGAGTQSVSLSATGLLATATLSGTSLAFGNVTVSSTSSAQSVTLTNNGNTPLAVSAAGISAPFADTTTCAATLAAGASCSYSVTFVPTVMGAAAGSLTINTGLGSPTVALTGTGLQTSSTASTASLPFGSVNVGSTSTAQIVTVSNTGNTPVTVSAMTTSGPFAATQTCGTLPATIATSGNCQVSVTFTPTVMGAATGTLTLTTSGGTQTVSLTGTGLQATASLSATTLALGSVNVGATSGAQSVTLTNNGNTPLTVAAAGITAPFANTTTCAASLAAGASCTYSVTLTPTALGAASGTLTVNTGLGAQAVNLSGTGLLAVAGISPTSVAFGSLNVNATSAASTVTLSNTGNTSMTVGTPTLTGPFAKTTTCGTTLAASGTCTVSLTFTPTVMGAATGTLSIPTGSGTQTVSLLGTGLQTSVGVSTGSLAYPATNYGTTSSAQTVTLTNTGNTTVTVSGVTVSGAYAVTHNCPVTLTAGASCLANVTFSPATLGVGALSQTGTLTFSTSASNPTVALTGTELISWVTGVTGTLAFGSVQVGQTALSSVVTLQSTGNLNASAFYLNLPTGYSLANSTCPTGATFTAGTSCTFQVQFAPTAAQSYNGTLTSGWTGPGATTGSITLTATSVAASDSTSVGTLTFASTYVGSSTAAQSVTLTNTGIGPVSVSTPTVGTANYSLTHNCPATLSASATCTVNVVFSPTSAGTLTDTLTIPTGAGSKTVSLSGTGLPRIVSNIVVSANAQNYVLNTAKVTGYVAGNTDVTLTINAGVYVGSTSTATAGLVVDASWAAGDTVTIINNGYILGAGGAGGNAHSTAGGAGGPALTVSRATRVTNSGTIGGGGGGGGAGGATSVPAYGYLAGTGGGGGGAGYSAGAGGASSGNLGNPVDGHYATNGSAGTTTAGGAGGLSEVSYPAGYNNNTFVIGGVAGAGGGWGAAGVSGTAPGSVGVSYAGMNVAYYAPTAGGAGGPATSAGSNALITWTATGNRYGALN